MYLRGEPAERQRRGEATIARLALPEAAEEMEQAAYDASVPDYCDGYGADEFSEARMRADIGPWVSRGDLTAPLIAIAQRRVA